MVKTKTEQFLAPKRSTVTAASIMRLIRFKMGQISEEKYYEMELKELKMGLRDQTGQTKMKDETLTAFDENLDVHLNQRKLETQQEIYRKKE